MSLQTPPTVVSDARSSERLTHAWNRLRSWDSGHRTWTDVTIAAVMAAACLLIPEPSGVDRSPEVILQLALVAPLIWRRRAPSTVFAVIAVVAFAQWMSTIALPADMALLVALFTVADHQPTPRALGAAGVLEIGVVMASIRWTLAGSVVKSALFLTGMVIAALFVGITLRTWRAYHDSLIERARRLEVERDQQSKLAAAAERARIAREMHDVVAHNMAIMVTLADAARAVMVSNAQRAEEAMAEVAATGRTALNDMRRLLGVFHSDSEPYGRFPQPDIAGIEVLLDRVRSTGLAVEYHREGVPFAVPSAVGLAIYRIVQESLTNVMKHAVDPTHASVRLRFDSPFVELSITDDGMPATHVGDGHGVIGMRERAAVCGGSLVVGPGGRGGWEVATTIRVEPARIAV